MMEFSIWKVDLQSDFKEEVQKCLVVVSLVCFVIWAILKNAVKLSEFGKQVDKFPGPFSLPLLGTIQFAVMPKTECLNTFVRWSNKFNGSFRVWFLNEPYIFITSPEYVKKILDSKEHISKSEFYEPLKQYLGNGLITVKSSQWKAHRKLLAPSVNGKMVDIFVNICNEYLEVFHEVLEKAGNIGGETVETPICLHSIMQRFMFDVINEAIVGKRVDTLRNSSNSFLDAANKVKKVCSRRWHEPWLRWKWLWAIHPLRKHAEQLARVMFEIAELAIVERRRLRKEADMSSTHSTKRAYRGALIDTLLDAGEEPANVITDDYIKDEFLTFLTAGYDTSVDAILWTMFLLGNNLDAQDKVYEELVASFGGNKCPNFTFDDLQRLTFLEECIKETLRLYPSIPAVVRKVYSDVVLDSGLVIPAGADVLICISSIHKNPEEYPNPDKFDPKRFSPENIEKRHPFAYCPFSKGPRNCIGQRFAEVAMKSVLARVFLNFSIVSVNKPEDVKAVVDIALVPDKPLLFYVKIRY